ncbi:MAG: hypothetical protein ACRECR_05910, partial [Thermoplasmata archaeon]
FYNYVDGVVNTTPLATGTLPNLAWNTTVRAQIRWTPGVAAGSYSLYLNATATNEFPANYGPNVASVPVSIAANPYANLLEYVVIAVVAVAAVLLVIFLLLRQRRRPASGGRGSSGGSKGSGSDKYSGKGGTSTKGSSTAPKSSAADDDDDDDDEK